MGKNKLWMFILIMLCVILHAQPFMHICIQIILHNLYKSLKMCLLYFYIHKGKHPCKPLWTTRESKPNVIFFKQFTNDHPSFFTFILCNF